MTEPPRDPDARTLAAFLSDECSPSQAAEVTRWAQSSADAAARLQELRATWHEAAQPKPRGVGAWEPDQLWNAIAPRLDETGRAPLHLVAAAGTAGRASAGQHPSFGTATRRGAAGRAAVAAACVVIFGAIAADQHAVRERARMLPPPHAPAREYRTERGQRASVTLPDGSAFQLGPESVLRVPGGYDAPDRVVELEGDGYFNVTHDPLHPFSVRTAHGTIHDIGTRFVVRARSSETRVEIAVADGEVSVQARGRLAVSAGQAALVDERGNARLLPHAAVASRFAWTRGELVFDRVLVPDILAELSRWYGSTFVLADKSLDAVRLTTTLRGETLLEALVVLETALDVDAHVAGDTVTLERHRAEIPKP